MFHLSNEFGYRSGSDTSVSNAFNCAVTPSTTMLGVLDVKLNTHVDATPVDTMRVSANTQGAGAMAQQNVGVVQGMQANVDQAKGSISAAIETAQRQVLGAAQAAGYSAAELYPDTRMAGSEGGLLFQAGLDGMGAGSVAMALVKNAPSIGLAMGDRKVSGGENKAKAEAEMRDMLISASSGPIDSRAGNFGLIANADETPVMNPVSLNWERFFANGHEIADLMALDPDNPNPAIITEWRDLGILEGNIENVTDDLNYVQENYPVTAAACDDMVLCKEHAQAGLVECELMMAGIVVPEAFDKVEVEQRLGQNRTAALSPEEIAAQEQQRQAAMQQQAALLIGAPKPPTHIQDQA